MSHRIPLYYELFFGLAENQKLEQGLRYVASTESQCSPLVQEMALAVLEEMEFFGDMKNHPLSLTIYRPRNARVKPPPIITTDQFAYDPLLQEMAKAVLDEIDYNRGQRKWAQGLVYFVLAISILGLIAVCGIIIWICVN